MTCIVKALELLPSASTSLHTCRSLAFDPHDLGDVTSRGFLRNGLVVGTGRQPSTARRLRSDRHSFPYTRHWLGGSYKGVEAADRICRR